MYCSLGELTTGTPEQRQGKGAAKSWGQWKYKRQKHRYQHACFCLATMLTSKIIAEIIEKKNILNFLGARIAAINLLQCDLDKPWHYLWYSYEKAPLPPLPPFWKGRRDNFPALRRPWLTMCVKFRSYGWSTSLISWTIRLPVYRCNH